jgi:hypothetical protein
MRKYLVSVVLIVGMSSLTTQAEEKIENPYQQAKIGDWILYKMTAKGLQDSETKQTVVEKDDKKIVIEMVVTIGGKDQPPTKLTFDFTEKKDPVPPKKGNEPQITELGSGTETLKIGDKKYNCTWKKIKIVVKAGDQEVVTETKTWLSKDVPLGGQVRKESKSKLFENVMELVDFGSKK